MVLINIVENLGKRGSSEQTEDVASSVFQVCPITLHFIHRRVTPGLPRMKMLWLTWAFVVPICAKGSCLFVSLRHKVS